jgi:hypothetical protein
MPVFLYLLQCVLRIFTTIETTVVVGCILQPAHGLGREVLRATMNGWTGPREEEMVQVQLRGWDLPWSAPIAVLQPCWLPSNVRLKLCSAQLLKARSLLHWVASRKKMTSSHLRPGRAPPLERNPAQLTHRTW